MITDKIFHKIDGTQKSAIINMMLKPISMALSFIYVPILISYLGTERYGLWATILTLISWINYCDVGIGQGLRNLLTKQLTESDYESAQKSITTAYIVLFSISIVLLCLIILTLFTVDCKKIFNTQIDIRTPLCISFIFICTNFVLALCNMLLHALQLSEKVSIRYCFTQVLNILGIEILSLYTSENLVLVSVLFGFTSSITYIYSTKRLFEKHKYLRIKFRCFDKTKIKEIAVVGVKFFLIQIPLIIIFGVDNLLVTNFYGGAMTASYSIVNSAFNAGYALFSAYIVPYWSRTTVALTNNDIEWIRKAAVRLNIIALISNVGLIILALLFEPLARLWVGKELTYPPYLVTVMCVYYCLLSIIMANVQIINGTGYLNIQLISNIVTSLLYIPTAYYFSKYCGFGVVGIKLAGVVLFSISAIIYPANLFWIIKKCERTRIKNVHIEDN